MYSSLLIVCLRVCRSVWPCVIISVISYVYLSKCLSICLSLPPSSPECPTESLSFGLEYFPLSLCPCTSRSDSIYCSSYCLFPHSSILPPIWFQVHLVFHPPVSNPPTPPPIGFQFHIFFQPSVAKSIPLQKRANGTPLNTID